MGEAAAVVANPQDPGRLDLQVAKAVVPREAVLSAVAGRRGQQPRMGVEEAKLSPFRLDNFLLDEHLVAGLEVRWLEHGLCVSPCHTALMLTFIYQAIW